MVNDSACTGTKEEMEAFIKRTPVENRDTCMNQEQEELVEQSAQQKNSKKKTKKRKNDGGDVTYMILYDTYMYVHTLDMYMYVRCIIIHICTLYINLQRNEIPRNVARHPVKLYLFQSTVEVRICIIYMYGYSI